MVNQNDDCAFLCTLLQYIPDHFADCTVQMRHGFVKHDQIPALFLKQERKADFHCCSDRNLVIIFIGLGHLQLLHPGCELFLRQRDAVIKEQQFEIFTQREPVLAERRIRQKEHLLRRRFDAALGELLQAEQTAAEYALAGAVLSCQMIDTAFQREIDLR